MKVLKNNCTTKVLKTVPSTLKINCDTCDSELEITKEDTHIGWLGAVYVTCPCCGEETIIDELEGITLTKDNVEFPTHFNRTNKDLRNVVEISPDKITDAIKKAIEYFRQYKDAFAWYTASGDSLVAVYNNSGDEEYFVMVTKDYYTTYIPFEPQDYE